MNVASLDNCRKIHELYGWEDTDKWSVYDDSDLPEGKIAVYNIGYTGPLYDAAYIILKLPYYIDTKDARGTFEFFLKKTHDQYFAGYNKPELGKWLYDNNHGVWEKPCSAHTLGDAVALLAIELKEKGVV